MLLLIAGVALWSLSAAALGFGIAFVASRRR